MNRRSFNSQSSNKSKARIARVQDKLLKLRERVKRSTALFFERRQARISWWQRAFRTPMVGGRWVFSQAKSLWAAFMSLLGFVPARRSRLLARRSDIRGAVARKAVTRNRLFAEGLEKRQLLAGDLFYVDAPSDYSPANPPANTVATWAGQDGDLLATGDNQIVTFEPAVVASGAAYGTIQAAINAASSNDIINLAPGVYVENLTIPQKT